MHNLQSWINYKEGMHIEWPFSFSMEDIRSFAKLSNDYNPIHLDYNFAKSKGFDSPLVYGLLLSSQMSRLIGQELPDKNSILTNIKMDFVSPCFPDEKLIFTAKMINLSDSTYSFEFKCSILRESQILCRGMVGAVWRP
jgi:3-hydroxybutyryl-CoA dehydratase